MRRALEHTEHFDSTSTLHEGDYVKVFSKQPSYHFCRCCGDKDIKLKDIDPEEYIAVINTVIDGRCCYVTTVRPSGYNFIADLDEMVCKVAPEELSEAEKGFHLDEYLTTGNRYVNAEDVRGSIRHKCEVIARKAVESLFPDADIDEVKLQETSWFRTKDIIENVDMLFNEFGAKNRTAEKRVLLEDMHKDFVRGTLMCRFKQYYTVYVGIKMPEEQRNITVFWLVPVAMDFSDAYVLTDIEERNHFFRSLGPEFIDMEDALDSFRRECLKESSH